MKTPFTLPTLSLIRDLNSRGISRMSVAMRHSARHYGDDVRMEPFMCLTGQGRAMAQTMGEGLPENVVPHFFSSYIGRCIETSYLMDKGFVRKTGGLTLDNRVAEDMSPFYVRDIKKTLNILLERDSASFIRFWMDGGMDDNVLMKAEEAAERMLTFMAGSLMESERNSIQISVTHDWNIYLLKEYGLGLPHESFGEIGYLEGVVVFEENGKLYVANHQKEPVPLRNVL